MVRSAVESRRPISAVYHDLHRLSCPHRLGRNKEGQLRVLCYQYGGRKRKRLKPVGSPDNWRCIALDKLEGGTAVRRLANRANHSRPASCIVDPDVDAEDYPPRDPQQGQ